MDEQSLLRIAALPSAAERTLNEAAIGQKRPPQQQRSRDSLGRMLDAFETLLTKQGNDDFTLSEVGRVGKVSIGSIYARFASKDELVHAVHERLMQRLEDEQSKIVMRARARSTGPVELVRALLEDLADFLHASAPTMRPMMLIAASDLVVQERGRIAHDKMAGAVVEEMLTYRDRMRHDDPERVVRLMVRVAYASFARELGFGMQEPPPNWHDWAALKSQVGLMVATYLFCAPDSILAIS